MIVCLRPSERDADRYKEFTEGFYYGITGLLTQPARGFQKSGGRGLVKGVGKGVGGVFFKPAAGMPVSNISHFYS